MAKQPYIPLYTGDYLQDTRTLPLAVRGAWIDIMIFMWRSKERGVVIGTPHEFAMMMSCTLDEANFVIGLLQQKSICDHEILSNGMVKLSCRRMIRDAEISKNRSNAGKKGMENRYDKKEYEVCYNKSNNKSLTNSDNDIDNDNDIELKIKESLDEIYIDAQKPKWSHVDFDFELKAFIEKVRGSPAHYQNHDTGGMRLAFQSQLRNAKRIPDKTKQPKKEISLEELKARRNGNV